MPSKAVVKIDHVIDAAKIVAEDEVDVTAHLIEQNDSAAPGGGKEEQRSDGEKDAGSKRHNL